MPLLFYRYELYEMTFQNQHDKTNMNPEAPRLQVGIQWTPRGPNYFQKDLWCLHHDAAWSLGFLQKMLVIHFHTCDIMDPRTPCLLHAYIDRVNGLWGAVPQQMFIDYRGLRCPYYFIGTGVLSTPCLAEVPLLFYRYRGSE